VRKLGLATDVVDSQVYDRTVARFREARLVLPTFAELAEPATIPTAVRESLAGVDPDAPDARNLFRVHWHNDASRRGLAAVPEHLELPPSLTGVRARISSPRRPLLSPRTRCSPPTPAWRRGW
jgi:hypothetical protein